MKFVSVASSELDRELSSDLLVGHAIADTRAEFIEGSEPLLRRMDPAGRLDRPSQGGSPNSEGGSATFTVDQCPVDVLAQTIGVSFATRRQICIAAHFAQNVELAFAVLFTEGSPNAKIRYQIR